MALQLLGHVPQGHPAIDRSRRQGHRARTADGRSDRQAHCLEGRGYPRAVSAGQGRHSGLDRFAVAKYNSMVVGVDQGMAYSILST